MNAKEMFSKLGFEVQPFNPLTYILPYSMDGVGMYLTFNAKCCLAQCINEMQELSSGWSCITVDVYLAITQQMKELGWI